MNKRSLFASAVVLSLLTGCGGPTLDASSEDTLKTSADKVMAGLSAEKQEKFQKAMGALMIKAAMASTGEESAKAKIKETFNGKTADDIIAEGEKAQTEAKAEMEKMMK